MTFSGNLTVKTVLGSGSASGLGVLELAGGNGKLVAQRDRTRPLAKRLPLWGSCSSLTDLGPYLHAGFVRGLKLCSNNVCIILYMTQSRQFSFGLNACESSAERKLPAETQSYLLCTESLNAALRAARENAARLLEESSRENAALIRKAFDDGFGRMRETLAVAQVIVWLALSAALVALGITACYILRLH